MTDVNYAHIVFLLDRSRSMDAIRAETIAGFNAFIAEQKKETGRCTFTLVQFDCQDPQEVVHDMVPVADLPAMTAETFVPRGNTPLFDAMARLIINTGKRLADMPEHERPGRVIFVTLTDGQENSSTDFSGPKLLEMIRHQREVYGWQFVYLGANQDAIATAVELGIDSSKSMTYATTPDGAALAFRSSSRLTSELRRSTAYDLASAGFTEDERKAQEKELRRPRRKR